MFDNVDGNFVSVLEVFLSFKQFAFKFSFSFWSTFFQINFVYIGTCRFAILVFRNRKTYVRVFDFESPEKLEKSLTVLRVCLTLPYDKVFEWSKLVC